MNALIEDSIEEAELWTLAVFPPAPLVNVIPFPAADDQSTDTATLTADQKAEIDRIVSNGRNATIAAIRQALRARSGKAWSVTGGRGTAWGWISIFVPPARLVDGKATPEDLAELAVLMGEERIHHQGISIPSSDAYYRLHLCQAMHGHPGDYTAQPYWD